MQQQHLWETAQAAAVSHQGLKHFFMVMLVLKARIVLFGLWGRGGLHFRSAVISCVAQNTSCSSC